MPIAAAPPVFNPPECEGEVLLDSISVPLVGLAVGFSVGIEGRDIVGPPAAVLLLDGGPGKETGGEETEGGVEGNVDGGGTSVEGVEGGVDGNVDGGGASVEEGEGGGVASEGGKGVVSGGFSCGGGGEVVDGGLGTLAGGGGEGGIALGGTFEA